MRSHLDRWFAALEQRHLSELTWQEVTRALRALSSAYVQKRDKLASGGALDGRGKRAAFALFYGPLHFAAVWSVIEELSKAGETPGHSTRVVDAGCGTGAGASAWALATSTSPGVTGIDVHPWAVDEARWTYRFFNLKGSARRGDVAALRPDPRAGLVAAYTLNELDRDVRDGVLRAALANKGELLVIEPIARGIAPWWDEAASAVRAHGGRADDWKLPLDMPERWRLLDRAAGFRRDHLTARSLWMPARS